MRNQTGKIMNYEELLAARNEGKKSKTKLPIGGYYREQVDGKWCGVVDIRPDMNSNISFSKALQAECERNTKLNHHRQIHFTAVEHDGDITQLLMEPGHFQTFEKVLLENPAVVAEKGFIDDVLKSLVDITSYLHQQGIKHVCYSPKTVFVRKGDSSALLLTHGEFYLGLNDLKSFYGEDASYVAPEVFEHGTIDERCDVYGIGKFIQSLFDKSDLPLEYRAVIKKAISDSPDDRYASPEDMLKSIQKRRNTLKSILTFAAAVVIALFCVALYFDMFPESNPVEFVKPAPRQPGDDLIDDGFDPAGLGVIVDGDSLVVDEEAMRRNYQAKAEEIFRKRYEKEADRILSKIYNNNYMNNSEKKFMSESKSTIEELMEAQSSIGSEAGLSPERSQLIATEIIERVTNQKKKAVGAEKSLGVQKK